MTQIFRVVPESNGMVHKGLATFNEFTQIFKQTITDLISNSAASPCRHTTRRLLLRSR